MSTTVMTGGSSGFGAIAAERLTLSGNARLILGARRPTSVGESMPLDPDRDPDRDARPRKGELHASESCRSPNNRCRLSSVIASISTGTCWELPLVIVSNFLSL